ncbi:MAG: head completion/stabilization protein [Pseudomonas sp.]|nr:head completion/stabilization protein [Pseudomonas arcuscaelestis]MDN5507455.1 head completion/stabilization protein [Comamonas sp.]
MQSDNYAVNHADRCYMLTCDDPFWPSINLRELRQHLALCGAISDTRLEVAARAAAHKAGREFAQWRRVLRDRGYKRLEDMASHQLLSGCYRRAVEANTHLALEKDVLLVACQPGPNGVPAHE